VEHDAIGDDFVAKVCGSVAHRAHVFRNANRRHDDSHTSQRFLETTTMMNQVAVLLVAVAATAMSSHVDLSSFVVVTVRLKSTRTKSAGL
jgi:hypothetical protein